MDKVSELIQQIRHYSQLRFAIFTVFLATTGGLLAAFFRSDATLGQFFLMLLGVLFSVTFAYFQLKLGAIYNQCLEELETSAEEDKKVGGEFVRLLFGEKVDDPVAKRLNNLKKRFAEKLPGLSGKYADQLKFVGPINLAILLLHLMVVGMWLLLFLIELERWIGSCG